MRMDDIREQDDVGIGPGIEPERCSRESSVGIRAAGKQVTALGGERRVDIPSQTAQNRLIGRTLRRREFFDGERAENAPALPCAFVEQHLAEARKIAGKKIIVGKSTHSFDQAVAAQEEGADYIGFGPLFATPTKPDYPPIGLNGIRRVHDGVRIPIFCIGGIKLDNLMHVIAAGAQRVVIVSGLLMALDIVDYARACKKLLIADL